MGRIGGISSVNQYTQHSVILAPANAPGITVHRMLSVFGYDDAPHGHGHITLHNVRAPVSNIVLGKDMDSTSFKDDLAPVGSITRCARLVQRRQR